MPIVATQAMLTTRMDSDVTRCQITVAPDSQQDSAKLKVRRATMVSMTETPEHTTEPTAAEAPSRSDRPDRRSGVLRLGALVAILAGSVFIIAVVFWRGFILGSGGGDEGGDHHGDGGGGSSQEKDGSRQENGMTHYGLSIERTVPPAGFAG